MSRFGNNQICGHCNKTKSKNLTSNNKKLKIANCCCSCKFLIISTYVIKTFKEAYDVFLNL